MTFTLTVPDKCTHLCMFSVLMLNSGSGSQLFCDGYEKVPWMTSTARKEMIRPNPMRRKPARNASHMSRLISMQIGGAPNIAQSGAD